MNRILKNCSNNCYEDPTVCLSWEREGAGYGWLSNLPKNVVVEEIPIHQPGRVAQSVTCLTQEPGVPGSIPGLAKYFCFSFR